MAYQTVQFTEAKDVVQAYLSNEVPAFSIRNKEQLLFTYKGNDLNEGAELLTGFLNLLKNSSGIYALCVYEKLSADKRITNKTEYDGSFNFRFQDQIQAQGAAYYSREVMSELNALKEEIRQLKEEKEQGDDEEKPSEILGAIGEFVNTPVGAQLVGLLLEKVVGWVDKKEPEKKLPEANTEGLKAVSGVHVDYISVDVEKQMEKDLQKLCHHSKDFPDLLHKLALLAEKKPFQFNLYAGMLRTMKI